MGWGVPRRPTISTKIGRPGDREGSDGDIQIKGTRAGAKFFAKWAGRWLGISDLLRGEEERDDVFTVKAWQGLNPDNGTDDSDSFYIYFPSFITPANYLGVSCAVEFNTGVSGTDFWFIEQQGGSTAAIQDNYNYRIDINWNDGRIEVNDMKSTISAAYFQNTRFFATIFFKG